MIQQHETHSIFYSLEMQNQITFSMWRALIYDIYD